MRSQKSIAIEWTMIATVGPQQAQTQFRGHTIWIADAHRDNGNRFVVQADEKLTAFVELEAAIRLAASGRATAAHKEKSRLKLRT